MKTRICTVPSHSPYETLALEEALLDTLSQDEIILLLYQHDCSVIVGRNQNVWTECSLSDLREGDVRVARRISGGGAVYHDTGNLNFSFIVPKEHYDLRRQYQVLLAAVNSFGIDAHCTGRNDLVASGRKFSGNAFCFRGNAAFHHGTLLIDTDIDKMQRCLHVSAEKIRAKGIASVRSRVVNLYELSPQISTDSMRTALVDSFAQSYGEPGLLDISRNVLSRTVELTARNRSWEWVYGRTPRFEIEFGRRFSWGSAQFLFRLQRGRIAESQVFSDAMEPALINSIPAALSGLRFRRAELCAAIRALHAAPAEEQIQADLCTLVSAHVP